MTSRFIMPTADVGSGLKPSDGAKLSFFEAGTSTPKDTFSDSAGTIPNSNPVISDSVGVFPDIFIKGDYKVTLTDKNNVQAGFGEADPVGEFALKVDGTTIKNFATLALAIADVDLSAGDALNLKERVSSKAAGGMWDVVLLSTVTVGAGAPSVGNIVAWGSNTGAGTDLALEYRQGSPVLLKAYSGAYGDGSNDDTSAIQFALTNVANGNQLFVEKGRYKITGTGNQALTLAKNIDIIGDNARDCVWRLDSGDTTTSILSISMQENDGQLDVRNWRFENMTVTTNAVGKHALWFPDETAFGILTSNITNCSLKGYQPNAGYDIRVEKQGQWKHSRIEGNTFNMGIFLNCGDANSIKDNLFQGGASIAITLDLDSGVYNTKIEDNTIVNRDGALHIINGDNVRFSNNQVEQFGSFGANTSTPATMVFIEGRDRILRGNVIEDNNLGGGTNVDYLIYIDNAQHTVITKNHLVASDIVDIFCTANAKFNIYEFDNTVKSQVSDPRTDPYFKAKFTTLGGYNIQMPFTLAMSNSWVSDGFAYKDKDGRVQITGTFSAGITTSATLITTLPVGMWPLKTLEYAYTQGSEAGVQNGDYIKIVNTNGQILSGQLSSNAGFSFIGVRGAINSLDF